MNNDLSKEEQIELIAKATSITEKAILLLIQDGGVNLIEQDIDYLMTTVIGNFEFNSQKLNKKYKIYFDMVDSDFVTPLISLIPQVGEKETQILLSEVNRLVEAVHIVYNIVVSRYSNFYEFDDKLNVENNLNISSTKSDKVIAFIVEEL